METFLHHHIIAFPFVLWAIVSNIFPAGTKHRLSMISRGYRHTISVSVTDMSREDAGAYRCHVENTLGRAQAELFLHRKLKTKSIRT